jgi:hypothetical protein
MSKLMIAMFISAGLGVAGPALAQTAAPSTTPAPITKDASTAAKPDANAQQKVDLDACTSMSGAAKDKCVTQANSKAKISLAKEESAAAIAKCDALSGAAKDTCLKDVKTQ